MALTCSIPLAVLMSSVNLYLSTPCGPCQCQKGVHAHENTTSAGQLALVVVVLLLPCWAVCASSCASSICARANQPVLHATRVVARDSAGMNGYRSTHDSGTAALLAAASIRSQYGWQYGAHQRGLSPRARRTATLSTRHCRMLAHEDVLSGAVADA